MRYRQARTQLKKVKKTSESKYNYLGGRYEKNRKQIDIYPNDNDADVYPFWLGCPGRRIF